MVQWSKSFPEPPEDVQLHNEAADIHLAVDCRLVGRQANGGDLWEVILPRRFHDAELSDWTMTIGKMPPKSAIQMVVDR